jgi:NAD+ synthetase
VDHGGLVRLALAQENPTIGDLDGNRAALLAAAEAARADGARLLVTPELALTGYPPHDLLERPAFLDAVEAAERALVDALPEGLTIVLGTVRRRAGTGQPLVNAAVVAERGRVLGVVAKSLLPVYDVFDEARYFHPGAADQPAVFMIDGLRVGVTVCEDLWNDAERWPARLYAHDPVERLARAGAELIVNLSSSPWQLGKTELREALLVHAARRHGVWMALANQVGGNDGLVFDGASCVVAPGGAVVARGPRFEAARLVADVGPGARTDAIVEPAPVPEAQDLHDAIVLGIRDFFRKCGVSRAVLGLSGGIDSAVTAALAVEALGAANVTGLSMPSRYSSEGSRTDAAALAAALGVAMHTVEIEPMFEAFLGGLAPVFAGRAPDLTEENLQSRIRGTLVMAYANKFGAMALSTGNKSECAVGYATLYGDTNGGLSPLADLYKAQVYAVARWMNRDGERIPWASIDKPPSAELRPGQLDQDSLPPYPVLDEILRRLIELRQPIAAIVAETGFERAVVDDVARKLSGSEFKRKQLPPTIRVSGKAWLGRVHPIAQRFSE